MSITSEKFPTKPTEEKNKKMIWRKEYRFKILICSNRDKMSFQYAIDMLIRHLRIDHFIKADEMYRAMIASCMIKAFVNQYCNLAKSYASQI